jgi:hypothetical protein
MYHKNVVVGRIYDDKATPFVYPTIVNVTLASSSTAAAASTTTDTIETFQHTN